LEKKTLSSILEGKLFNIPDYQRGYAWGKDQWDDFIEDIDTLTDEKIISHYTGTIVIYQKNEKPTELYGTRQLEVIDVVDGQQRLTTCSLYLSIILHKLIQNGHDEYNAEIPNYLYSGSKTKLKLNNEASDYYFDLISRGSVNIELYSVHQKRLLEAYNYLNDHIREKTENNGKGDDYLISLYDAIIRKLHFSFYDIEVESEIGMTFELMNSRGKDLSFLELLKNYFMYWIWRNIHEKSEKKDFTSMVNKTWKEVFINIAKCNGKEDQCLRIVWTLFVSYNPKEWKGYKGFKSDKVIPIRHFNEKTEEEAKELLLKIIKYLSVYSYHYSRIIKPDETVNSTAEYKWLMKIKRGGVIEQYLPLLVVARRKYEKKTISENDYINLLMAIEKYIYRISLIKEKRSTTGRTRFFKWAYGLLRDKYTISEINDEILKFINNYADEKDFRKWLNDGPDKWYEHHYKALKYTLYEYELFLLETEGKDVKPKLDWASITDSTIEHIFPQNPKDDSKWLKDWLKEDIRLYMHDISNLVLTNDNSHYQNFDFERKKGKPGEGHCYCNSDIRQERKISEYADWNVESCRKRRKEWVDWIIKRWGIDNNLNQAAQ